MCYVIFLPLFKSEFCNEKIINIDYNKDYWASRENVYVITFFSSKKFGTNNQNFIGE